MGNFKCKVFVIKELSFYNHNCFCTDTYHLNKKSGIQ
jgi:hypothetical protein